MKKPILLSIVLTFLFSNLCGQLRKLRQYEITYYNNLYPVLYAAVPHSYQDWKPVGDGRDFDALKYFCPVIYPGNNCTGKCPVMLGKSMPYSLNYKIEFIMPASQSESLMAAAYKTITDYNDATQIAAALKSSAKARLSITITVNVSAGTSVLSYCAKSPPVKIALPVPATLALLGTHSETCPFMTDGRPDTSPGDGYYDEAIIFLGRPVTAQWYEDKHDGQARMKYAIGFDKTKIGLPITQNIVIQLKGDAADIDTAVREIDWKALYGLIGK